LPQDAFIDLRKFGVRDENDVLFVYRKLAGQRIGLGIAQIETVDGRRYAVRRAACDRLA